MYKRVVHAWVCGVDIKVTVYPAVHKYHFTIIRSINERLQSYESLKNRRSSASTLLYDHVGYIALDDVILIIKVQHGHGAEFGGDTAGVHGAWTHPPHAVLVYYSGVK